MSIKDIPKAGLDLRDDKKVELRGFDNVDMWARLNDPTWRLLTRSCNIYRVQEIDRLRLLAIGLLMDKYEAIEKWGG